MACVLSSMHNIAISVFGKKGAKVTSPEDFLPDWQKDESEESPVKKQTVEEMKSFLLSFAEVHNKRLKEEEMKLKRLNRPPIINQRYKPSDI